MFTLEFADFLLNHAADGSIRSGNGETPVDVAKRWMPVYGDAMLAILARHGFPPKRR